MKIIEEFKLSLEPVKEEDSKLIGFKYNKEKVNESKIGGNPDFIQNEEWPKCECCGEKMSFYAQLDSVGDSICVADCGLIYVFICFDCYTTKSIIQSY